jgi:hypothetical protein
MDNLSNQAARQVPRELSPQIVSILTTEHYNLQNGRANTISDASGRANLFIGAVSITLVALGFFGQAAGFGTPFFIFSLILFPTLYFLGFVTFERTLQSTIEDITYARGMSRLRHLFLEYAPDLAPYIILSSTDDAAVTLGKMGMQATPWQIILGTAGTIAVVNSVVGGAFIGLLLVFFKIPLLIGVISGIVFFATSTSLCLWYNGRAIYRAMESIPTLFPAPSGLTQQGE